MQFELPEVKGKRQQKLLAAYRTIPNPRKEARKEVHSTSGHASNPVLRAPLEYQNLPEVVSELLQAVLKILCPRGYDSTQQQVSNWLV